MARRLKRSSDPNQPELEHEVPGVYLLGGTGLPGAHGPYPGPWFTLSIYGEHHRGRYTEAHVWCDSRGRKLSTLMGDIETRGGERDPRVRRVWQQTMESM